MATSIFLGQTGSIPVSGNTLGTPPAAITFDPVNGRVGIGTTSPPKGFVYVSDGGTAPVSALLPGGVVMFLQGADAATGALLGIAAGNTAAIPGLNLRAVRARGTPAVPLVLQGDDELGRWDSEGYTGSARQSCAKIATFCEDVSGSTLSGYLSLYSASLTSGGVAVERVRVNSTALATLGNVAVQPYGYRVGGRMAYGQFQTATSQQTLSGASVTATGLIPAGVFLIGVATTTTTTITGATGYTVGDGSDADRFGDITGTATGTHSANADATADPTGWAAAARNVVLTAKTSNFTGGVVQIVAVYLTTGSA